jgi:hypothetical protein
VNGGLVNGKFPKRKAVVYRGIRWHKAYLVVIWGSDGRLEPRCSTDDDGNVYLSGNGGGFYRELYLMSPCSRAEIAKFLAPYEPGQAKTFKIDFKESFGDGLITINGNFFKKVSGCPKLCYTVEHLPQQFLDTLKD